MKKTYQEKRPQYTQQTNTIVQTKGVTPTIIKSPFEYKDKFTTIKTNTVSGNHQRLLARGSEISSSRKSTTTSNVPSQATQNTATLIRSNTHRQDDSGNQRKTNIDFYPRTNSQNQVNDSKERCSSQHSSSSGNNPQKNCLENIQTLKSAFFSKIHSLN